MNFAGIVCAFTLKMFRTKLAGTPAHARRYDFCLNEPPLLTLAHIKSSAPEDPLLHTNSFFKVIVDKFEQLFNDQLKHQKNLR